jgi:hypothetical protein
LTICEPLPGCTLDRAGGALGVIHAKSRAFVVAEIELGKVALQVLRADVVIEPLMPRLRIEK